MIILTGGAGFIGSNILKALNKQKITEIILVDDVNHELKKQNLVNVIFKEIVPISDFWKWEEENKNIRIDSIIHLGACTDTLETDENFLDENNVVYSQRLWRLATDKKIPFIYASSAATYGDGSLGFLDDHKLIPKLKPLNPYGQSKQNFDVWVLEQRETPPLWVGLKYFNVYGPGEAHKGRMASVVWHFIQQIKNKEILKLFKGSHGYDNGEQKRDFIYIDDVVKMTLYMLKISESGIYNIGTSKARSFNDIANVLQMNNNNIKVEYIPFPPQLIDSYQAHTSAIMNKLFCLGYSDPILIIENGVNQYIEYYAQFND